MQPKVNDLGKKVNNLGMVR